MDFRRRRVSSRLRKSAGAPARIGLRDIAWLERNKLLRANNLEQNFEVQSTDEGQR
jgi:hypothetical protein